MKLKQLVAIALLGLPLLGTAQLKVGDNPDQIDSFSILELESTDKALVLTRVTTSQMNAMTPLQGALVYNTEVKGIFYYDADQWKQLGDGSERIDFTFVDNNDGTFSIVYGNGDSFTSQDLTGPQGPQG
ncbi:MAG: hypothetical protein R3252_13880, partial [Robiginitalea sp.]|nr:hypothetical protein [Robiginitalea sp.]